MLFVCNKQNIFKISDTILSKLISYPHLSTLNISLIAYFCCRHVTAIRATPLWYSYIPRLQLNRHWHDKGSLVFDDLPDGILNVLSLEAINGYYNINMNFQEYYSLKIMLNASLEKPYFIERLYRNDSY